MAAAPKPAAPTATAVLDKTKWVFGKTQPITSHYALGRNLGQPGQFGYALLAVDKKTNEKRAVKVINKARFARAADRAYHFDQLRSEVSVMRAMKHKNIITLFELFEDEKDLYLVLELCSGGELFDRIKAVGNYSELDASKVLRQCFEGLKYMHDQKIAHCDLKPDNFLFLSSDKNAVLKVIDFGMSKFVKRRQYFEALSGTPYYVAPEVIVGKYSEHCDIWSLGVVMFVMLFGYPPFYADQEVHGALTDEKIFLLVKGGFSPVVKDGFGAHFPKTIPVSESARDLLTKLLIYDPAKRITAAEALEHPWLTGKTADDKPLLGTVLSNLTNFSANQKFKQAVLSLMSDMMTESEVAELQKTFAAIDANGDGNITVAELKAAFDKWGTDQKAQATKERLEELMKAADVNGDGVLSYQELLMTAVQRKLNGKEERLWEAFCKFDLNGDGKISKEEIAQVLGSGQNLGNVADLIAEADKNGDGSIDYDEFLTMWSSKQASANKATQQANAKATAAAHAKDGKDSKTAATGATAASASAAAAAKPAGAAPAAAPAAATPAPAAAAAAAAKK